MMFLSNLFKKKFKQNSTSSILDIDDFYSKIEKYLFPNMPKYLSLDDWGKWHIEAHKNYPYRYFLCFTLPKYIKSLSSKYFHKPKDYLYYRFYNKYNTIQINSLGYHYHDTDTRLVHGMFNLLIQFVENEFSLLCKLYL